MADETKTGERGRTVSVSLFRPWCLPLHRVESAPSDWLSGATQEPCGGSKQGRTLALDDDTFMPSSDTDICEKFIRAQAQEIVTFPVSSCDAMR